MVNLAFIFEVVRTNETPNGQMRRRHNISTGNFDAGFCCQFIQIAPQMMVAVLVVLGITTRTMSLSCCGQERERECLGIVCNDRLQKPCAVGHCVVGYGWDAGPELVYESIDLWGCERVGDLQGGHVEALLGHNPEL